MGKLFIFALLWRLTGNPILALIILLVILYALDRRFVGLTPSLTRPFKRSSRLRALARELSVNPHNVSAKVESARLLIEKKRYAEAMKLLEEARPVMSDSAEVLASLGVCLVQTGRLEEGEKLLRQAFELNPRVQYGEPLLRLGAAYAERDAGRAIGYLERFRKMNLSSCEAIYRSAQIYRSLRKPEEARAALREVLDVYRSLPRYKRKQERRWALLARLRLASGG